MNIVGTRIDGRLVHGQVANLWIPKLQVERVIVIDEKVANSDIEKSGLRLATPMGVKLSVLSPQRAAEQLVGGRYGNQRLFILAKGPQAFAELVNNGVKLDALNVGNMSKNDQTQAMTNSINITGEDYDVFQELAQQGVKLTAQMVPGTKEESFLEIMKKFNKEGNN